MQGCEHCGNLFEGFLPLGFNPDIDKSDVEAILGNDKGLYLIEVKALGREIVGDNTFIQSILSGRVPTWIIQSIKTRDVNPLIKHQANHDCTVIDIGRAKGKKKTLYKRFMDLLTGAHTNRNSLWIMIEHGWTWEFWYLKNPPGKVLDDHVLIDEYKKRHGTRKPYLNRKT